MLERINQDARKGKRTEVVLQAETSMNHIAKISCGSYGEYVNLELEGDISYRPGWQTSNIK